MMILIALGTLGGLTLVLATLLVVANRKLYVYEDPRIDVVEDMLPHANCGACGQPGCRPFAEALVQGKVAPSKCTVGSSDDHSAIATYLGISVGASEKRVARLACAGGSNVALNRASYNGIESCRGASLISGGGKGCFWGCLGLGDCESVCDFDAIDMDEHGLPVVDEAKCTACGDCVEVCPKDLFSLEPLAQKLWVACKNLEHGDEILADCQVGCTACGKCAMDAPGDLIIMEGNLPKIKFSMTHQSRKPIERCPTGAIVWLENGVAIRGAESRKVVRKGDRPIGFS